ncbi:exported hypothetical protein [Agrobacterium tomkonis CFBP 6623]|uniref:Uncharacterized protein n=1 Tax=Agrobacterium tomkonis CFBP 6623 TaxID=1183432 RepID=A0A1S7S8E1_9HYPH|nr:exported hypothetical protein [Agrobacterium tomkonis CFBP 6623]
MPVARQLLKSILSSALSIFVSTRTRPGSQVRSSGASLVLTIAAASAALRSRACPVAYRLIACMAISKQGVSR